MKLLLRAKKSFELARKSAMRRAQKEKSLYLYMTNGDDKHYILKMPNDLTIIRTLDSRALRLKDVQPVNRGAGGFYDDAKKKAKKEKEVKKKKKVRRAK